MARRPVALFAMSPFQPMMLTALAASLLLPSRSADGQGGSATGCRWGDEGPHPTIFGVLLPASDTVRAPEMYLGTLLQEALTWFRPPDTIANIAGGVLSMWLHADGRLSNVRPADTILPLSLANALTVAIDSLMHRGGAGPVLPPLAVDSIPLRLIVHWAGEKRPLSVPVVRLRPLPAYYEFQVDTPVQNISTAYPRYPSDLHARRVEGEVLIRMTVDADGQPEMTSLRVLKSSHTGFTRAVLDLVPRLRFSPALLDGCRVRQIIEIPFAFKIQR